MISQRFHSPFSLLLPLLLFSLIVLEPAIATSGLFDYSAKEKQNLAQKDGSDGNENESQQPNNEPSEESFTFNPEVPGPGVYFAALLNKLTNLSSGSEGRLKRMREALPEVIPELKKVFLTL